MFFTHTFVVFIWTIVLLVIFGGSDDYDVDVTLFVIVSLVSTGFGLKGDFLRMYESYPHCSAYCMSSLAGYVDLAHGFPTKSLSSVAAQVRAACACI